MRIIYRTIHTRNRLSLGPRMVFLRRYILHNSIFLSLRVGHVGDVGEAQGGRLVKSEMENQARQRQIFELICMTIPSAADPRKTLRTHQPRIQSRRKFTVEFTVGHTEFICESR